MNIGCEIDKSLQQRTIFLLKGVVPLVTELDYCKLGHVDAFVSTFQIRAVVHYHYTKMLKN